MATRADSLTPGLKLGQAYEYAGTASQEATYLIARLS